MFPQEKVSTTENNIRQIIGLNKILAKNINRRETSLETITMILQSAPYGDEKVWNALRLAKALITATVGMKVNVFLLGDSVTAAKKG